LASSGGEKLLVSRAIVYLALDLFAEVLHLVLELLPKFLHLMLELPAEVLHLALELLSQFLHLAPELLGVVAGNWRSEGRDWRTVLQPRCGRSRAADGVRGLQVLHEPQDAIGLPLPSRRLQLLGRRPQEVGRLDMSRVHVSGGRLCGLLDLSGGRGATRFRRIISPSG
jgi:hypothetical protein